MRHHQVAKLVKQAYENSTQEFAKWIWDNHLQLVAAKTEDFAKQFGADEDLAVAGAWLHDFGDAFVHRHSAEHDEISQQKAQAVLEAAKYNQDEIDQIIEQIIGPHSCKQGNLPTTIEGKVLATADAYAHLATDFYLQFAWNHLPQNMTFSQFVDWANEKIDRDFNHKIFFDEEKQQLKERYQSLQTVFSKS